jgi:hypothetical protein
MSEFLDKAIAYTRQERESSLLSINVKKFGEKVYFKPLGALSVEKFDQVLAGEKSESIDGLISVLIARCLDSSGRPLFNPMDRIQMKKELSPLLIAEITQAMSNAETESESVEDLEKNLEPMSG